VQLIAVKIFNQYTSVILIESLDHFHIWSKNCFWI